MAKVPEYYSIGDRDNLSVSDLLVILEDMYKDLAIALNKKPDVYQRTTNGLATDTFLNVGDININTSTNTVEMITNQTSTTNVTWTTLS